MCVQRNFEGNSLQPQLKGRSLIISMFHDKNATIWLDCEADPTGFPWKRWCTDIEDIPGEFLSITY